ncbi:MAG: hypothetical protein HZA52_18665 [Planctomycetes bacterium]|nr:hypothetical protein [Planctomycetota bacterium]
MSIRTLALGAAALAVVVGGLLLIVPRGPASPQTPIAPGAPGAPVTAASASTATSLAPGARVSPPTQAPTSTRPPERPAEGVASQAPELVPTDIDFFHPAHQPGPDGKRPALPTPAYGGRVIVRTDLMPPSLNYALDGAAVTRRILYEVHETLAVADFATGELAPDLAASWDVEDSLFLKRTVSPGAADETGAAGETRAADQTGAAGALERLVGVVTCDGEHYELRARDPHAPGAGANATATPIRVPVADVQSLERGTVITFHLRRDVHWQDGEPFDASDVAFSFSIYSNPRVRCDNKRSNYDKVRSCEVLDPYTVRFTLDQAQFKALGNLADLFLLPAHRYDLSDPDHARFDPEYVASKRAANPSWTPTADEQGDYVNEHPNNRTPIGLGPYRVTQWNKDFLEAERWDGYFAPEQGGWFDTIRWRLIENDNTANEALLAGEIDFNERLRADEYFGEFTQSKAFTDRCYKGYLYADAYGFVAWNLARKPFADVRVRQALGRLFDYQGVRTNYYRDQAIQVTGVQPVSSPAYDWSLEPLTFDPQRADELLTEAGWYDRDGDGLRDKDGEAFEFEITINTGSKTSEVLMARFQEELAKQGIRAHITANEWSLFQERCVRRDFDAAARGWVPPPEVDPDSLFHSRWAKPEVGGSNFCGFADPEVDRLIEAGQREIDDAERYAIWRELGRRIYAAQPYVFLFNPARKFGLNKSIRGFQALRFDPNYQLRRWYFPAGTPGTRATRAR